MKLLYKTLAATLSFSGLVACTPEDFEGANPMDMPSIHAVADDISISVNQETNTVTFILNTPGCMPQWTFESDNNITRSTRNGLQKYYPIAGDYSVRVRVGNRNGWSDAFVEKSFHIDNTDFDFGKVEKQLAGAKGDAQWRVDYNEKGHMGCGPSGTEGLEWWNADVNAKANEGVYDDRISFSGDGKYAYTPGDGGTMYLNYGVSLFPEYNKTPETDFMAPVDSKESSYTLSVKGTDLYLTLAPNSYFPYIPNDEFWNNPTFYVASIDSKKMELITDNGGIAWHFILTNVKDVEVFKGYKYNSDFNMWRDAVIDEISFFYADGGWNEYPEKPGVSHDGNKSFSFTMPNPTVDTWQNQVFIPTNIALSAAEKYDVSFIISSNVDVPKATAKLHKLGDDNTSLFAEVGSLNVKAGEDFVFLASELDGIDADATRFVFDFGGNAADAEITVSNIVIKNHANDDGTVLPEAKPETDPDVPQVDWDAASNLWASATLEPISFWYAPGWNQIADPSLTEKDGTYTVVLPEATTDQWMGQMTFKSNIALSAEKTYDFMIKLLSSSDHPGVTVKLVHESDDNIFLTDARHALVADQEKTVVFSAIAGKDINALKMVLDFGGNAADTEVTISDIRIQEHRGPKVVDWNFNSEKNLFKNANILDKFFYYAPGWSQLPNPQLSEKDGAYSFSLPDATTDQWQAQFALKTDVSTSADKKYDFHVVINSSADIAKVTVKMVLDGDDNNFYFTDLISLKADEDYTFVKTDMDGIDMAKVNFFFDFGGNPADTEITIKDLIVYEAE